ncbi:MAG: hypothetical protein BWZ03_00520 [bacterium ADurb.BinA186]|nr:MAG: hypothetical protein BWZ03_00520 [bacterium ADurb.BinA186]
MNTVVKKATMTKIQSTNRILVSINDSPKMCSHAGKIPPSPVIAVGNPKTNTITDVIITAFLRDMPLKSVKLATTTSNMDNDEVRAANNNRVKNTNAIIMDPGSCSNT